MNYIDFIQGIWQFIILLSLISADMKNSDRLLIFIMLIPCGTFDNIYYVFDCVINWRF